MSTLQALDISTSYIADPVNLIDEISLVLNDNCPLVGATWMSRFGNSDWKQFPMYTQCTMMSVVWKNVLFTLHGDTRQARMALESVVDKDLWINSFCTWVLPLVINNQVDVEKELCQA